MIFTRSRKRTEKKAYIASKKSEQTKALKWHQDTVITVPSLGVPLQCRAEEVDMVDQEEEVMGVVPAATAAKGEGAMEEVVVKVAHPLTEEVNQGDMGAAVKAVEAATEAALVEATAAVVEAATVATAEVEVVTAAEEAVAAMVEIAEVAVEEVVLEETVAEAAEALEVIAVEGAAAAALAVVAPVVAAAVAIAEVDLAEWKTKYNPTTRFMSPASPPTSQKMISDNSSDPSASSNQTKGQANRRSGFTRTETLEPKRVKPPLLMMTLPQLTAPSNGSTEKISTDPPSKYRWP